LTVSSALRSYRRNIVHVREALDLFKPSESDPRKVGVEGGYLEDAGMVERYKRLSIPVRRALNPNDRAGFEQALAELKESPCPREVRRAIDEAWKALQAELETGVQLGGARVPRRQILGAWLDAAAFYDRLERDRAYDRLIDQYGKAAEGIGTELTEHAVRVILMLDEAAAETLDEPVILPPARKTPPPPPDPKESWWKRLMGMFTPGP
jgi:hypothetical protein